MMAMPGKSYSGPLPPITPGQTAMAQAMQADLHERSVTIGPRNIHDSAKLAESADYIEEAFRSAGYLPQRHCLWRKLRQH